MSFSSDKTKKAIELVKQLVEKYKQQTDTSVYYNDYDKENLSNEYQTDTIDLSKYQEVFDFIKNPTKYDANDLYKMTQINEKSRLLERQVLLIALKHYSDANYVSYPKENDTKETNCFYIHDVRGTVIAHLWVDTEGKPLIYANEHAYGKRVN